MFIKQVQPQIRFKSIKSKSFKGCSGLIQQAQTTPAELKRVQVIKPSIFELRAVKQETVQQFKVPLIQKSPNPKSPNPKSPNHMSPNHKLPDHKSPKI